MNIQSEIEFFSDLGLVDKARFIMRLISEIAEEAKVGTGDGQDLSRLKFANEMIQRLARFSLSAAERGHGAARRMTW